MNKPNNGSKDSNDQLEEQFKSKREGIVGLEDNTVGVRSSREGHRSKLRSNTPTKSNKTQVHRNTKAIVCQRVDSNEYCLLSPCSPSDTEARDQLQKSERKRRRCGGRPERPGSVIAAVLKVLMGFAHF